MKKSKRPFQSYWNSLNEGQRRDLAKKMGTSVEYLYQISIDFRKGSPSFIKRLEESTDGRVPKEKMLPEVYA